MHIGQKVEFIGVGGFPGLPPNDPRPLLGHIYTVRALYTDPWGREPLFGIRVMEIVRETITHAGIVIELGWDRKEFRPIVTRKTDISVFTKMLNPEPVA